MASEFRIIAVGASAGGIPALETFVAGLPSDLPAAVFVVMHMRDYQISCLPEIFDRKGPLPAALARDGEEVRSGRIYVARAGHHLLVDDGYVGVKAGPKENRFRPSIDALFRSAAYTNRERVIGIILSGMLGDGTSGLWTIKRFGGVTIVQDPKEAPFDAMPLSALEQVEVDYTLPAGEIGPLVAGLSRTNPGGAVQLPDGITERVRKEVEVAASEDSFSKAIMNFGELTPFTCPECHGTLARIMEGTLLRYRCHTGHAFSANALISGVTDSIEASLWNALRAMEEGVMLLEHMATHLGSLSRAEEAKMFAQKAQKTRKRALAMQAQAVQSGDNLICDHNGDVAS